MCASSNFDLNNTATLIDPKYNNLLYFGSIESVSLGFAAIQKLIGFYFPKLNREENVKDSAQAKQSIFNRLMP